MTVAFMDSMRAEKARLQASDGFIQSRRRVALLAWLGRTVARVLFLLGQLRTVALSIIGFGLFTAAAYIAAGLWPALVVGGVSCFVFEYLSGDG